MKLKLIRKFKGTKYTIGDLFIDGNYITSSTYQKDSIDSPELIQGMSENQTQLFIAHCGSGSGRVYATGTQKTNITMIYINPM